MWTYRTHGHVLMIVPTDDGLYGFAFDDRDMIWEASLTPQDELDNICSHVTCCDEWDSQYEWKCPESLADWNYIPD